MKKTRYWLGLLIVFSLGMGQPIFAKNILNDLLKVYNTYQQVNMMMWLAGDVKAEKRVGEETKWFINLTNKKVKDPETNRWVSSVFERVKPQFRDRGFNYNITVLEGRDVNAFALPGGNIFVYKGMLDFIGSDDELAAVFAHELAHAEKRHSLKQLRQNAGFQILLEKAVKNKRDRDTWGQVVGALTMLRFSRQDEDEADDLGQTKMAVAGFDPAAQILLWDKFTKKFGKGETGILQYLSTHPPSQDRVENARKNLTKLGGVEKKSFALSYNILSDVEENLLQNSSFETDLSKKGFPDAWTLKDGTGALSAAECVTGRQALQLSADSTMRQVRVVSELIPVNLKEKYRLQGWVKSVKGVQRVSVGAELYDKSKRLRGFIWPVLAGAQVSGQWQNFEGMFEAGTTPGKNFTADTVYMRILLQNGPLSKGDVRFDDLTLRRGSYVPPKNYLTNGSFEIDNGSGLPRGIQGNSNLLARDTTKFKMGYAALRMSPKPEGGEVECDFTPVPLSEFKDGQGLQGSFHFLGSAEIKGRVIVALLDEAGNPWSRRLAEREFTTKPELWQATGWKAELRLSEEEKKFAKSLSIKIIAAIPATGTLWLDGFVLR